MTLSEFDNLRPSGPARRRRVDGKPGTRRRREIGDGSREMPMVPDAEFTSYYGRPVVKPAPWGEDVALYLFLGGVAGVRPSLAWVDSSPGGRYCAGMPGWVPWQH